ncbi:rod shape-determining protein RodA [Aestuariispira insulae]|uniref:Peptidoglycan glycosyltransferase MrdB n=1 Tax=Aestuariispira insulae TaxID=1461337 RepID=A0A3D9HXF7_9PROT|nr:rod shape-determining protein RodA [Aestuariispira insulae]RED54188.1 cell elongation-specific peptidoglycan biosynthesis regulator RodA [Aestuariispira insulae]
MAGSLGDYRQQEMSLSQKLWQVNWGLLLLITMIACVGFGMLYSAANGSWDPWASRQMLRFGVGLVLMLVIALIDIRHWLRFAYLLYAVGFVLLIGVEFFGTQGMGAKRWLDFAVFRVQPSEVMKIAMVLALARYFHGVAQEEIGRPSRLIMPILMVILPVLLILRQPDLGTALMLVIGSGVVFFLAGVRWWKFALVIAAALGSLPVAWQFLRDYQKQRVLTFMDPERDPLGAGYHITQSKIAMGSGGVFGKGFIQGTQSHLSFLPEKQTDFIFTMLAEEFGLVGGVTLMGLYFLLMVYGLAIAVQSRSQYGRLVALGLTTTVSLYVFINIAMVMGVIPVVGVPLPLVSNGGTAMMTVLIAFGLIMNVYIHREVKISRRWSDPLA